MALRRRVSVFKRFEFRGIAGTNTGPIGIVDIDDFLNKIPIDSFYFYEAKYYNHATIMVIGTTVEVGSKIPGISLTPAFFDVHYEKSKMNNPIIYLTACHGLEKPQLAETLLKRGAGHVWGYNELVRQEDAYDIGKVIIEELLKGVTVKSAGSTAWSKYAPEIKFEHGGKTITVMLRRGGNENRQLLTLQKIQVLDSTTNQPVPGAQVTVTRYSNGAYDSEPTDASGNLALKLPPDVYTVKVTANGYKEKSRLISFTENHVNGDTILLDPNVTEADDNEDDLLKFLNGNWQITSWTLNSDIAGTFTLRGSATAAIQAEKSNETYNIHGIANNALLEHRSDNGYAAMDMSGEFLKGKYIREGNNKLTYQSGGLVGGGATVLSSSGVFSIADKTMTVTLVIDAPQYVGSVLHHIARLNETIVLKRTGD